MKGPPLDRDKLIERLRGTFLLELQEHVRVFNRELLAIEKAGSVTAGAESVRTLFRTVHSLKGAARAVNATRLAGVCHRLEELLAGLRDGTRQLSPEIIATLFAAVDTFESTGREFGAGGPAGEAASKPATPPPAAAKRPEAGGTAAAPSAPEPGSAVTVAVPAADGGGAGALALGGGGIGALAAGSGGIAAPASGGGGIGATSPAAVGGKIGAAAEASGDRLGSGSGAPARSSAPLVGGGFPRSAAPGGGVGDLAGAGGAGFLPAAAAVDLASGSIPVPAAVGGGGAAAAALTFFPPAPAADAGLSFASGPDAANHNVEPETQLRVPARKLDELLAESGELLIARRRFEARLGQLTTLQERFAEVRRQWHAGTSTSGASAYGIRSRGLRRGQAALRVVGASVAAPVPGSARALERFPLALVALEQQLSAAATGLHEDYRALERVAEALEGRIHRVRMLPFFQATEGLQRALRDLARAQAKSVELTITGAETELDRAILDALRDPLLHLVRNAIDHGIESPAQRRAAGKPERAEIRISASLQGEQVCVTVSDDGRGIDFEAVQAAAHKRLGDASPAVSEDPKLLIFEPGVSTAAVVSEVSGRGVGLDVVKTQVEALRGSVEVSSELGCGTQFRLLVPLTLTTQRVLFVRAGSEIYALPSSSTRSLRRARPSELTFVGGREVLLLGAAPIPIIVLSELLGSPPRAEPAPSRVPLVVIGHQEQVLALAVDELLNEQEVVCKPLGKRVGRVPLVSAATVLPTGQLALLLHPAQLLRAALGRQPGQRVALAGAVTTRKRVLLVDDSATTRTLERGILEAAGYEVLIAVDGSGAFALLQEHAVDLVVSDVEMPNMDGFVLTEAIRSSRRFGALPVVLLTSLDSEADRERGMRSGANAYLVKSAFDQTHLLDTIRELL
jgi:two-component system chemotaxis sensor kinase CheA